MIIKSFQRLWDHFKSDSLFRNSIFLILATVVQAFFGFIFWIVIAHLYTSNQVGITTTLISAIALIGTLSLIGLNTSLIRYLPKSKNQNIYISTTIIIGAISAFIFSIIYLSLLGYIAPKLSANISLFRLSSLVIIGSISVTLLALSDSLFIALRNAKYVTITSTVFSTAKLGLAFAAVGLGSYGPFSAQIGGYLLAIGASVFIQYYLVSIRYTLCLDRAVLKSIRSFAAGSYVGSLANSLPGQLLPVFILRNLGASSVAYFYISLMIANVLFIIPQATTQSQFAEGSNEPEQIAMHVRRATILIAILMIPAIVLVILMAPLVLSVFGPAYVNGGTSILRLLCLSGIFISMNFILTTILRLRGNIRELTIIAIITTATTFLSAYALIGHGLTGIGIGWNIGEALTTVLLFIVFFNKRKLTSVRPSMTS